MSNQCITCDNEADTRYGFCSDCISRAQDESAYAENQSQVVSASERHALESEKAYGVGGYKR